MGVDETMQISARSPHPTLSPEAGGEGKLFRIASPLLPPLPLSRDRAAKRIDGGVRVRVTGLLSALALLALSACADLTGPPPAPKECPRDLSYLTPQLVTPYPKLEAFIGKDALEATLHKPIDESIVHGGGPERSIQMTEIQIKEYQNILDNQDQVRAEDQKAGMTDEWIATYFSSVQDGITINQAFIDATKCRQAKAAEQTESVPAS